MGIVLNFLRWISLALDLVVYSLIRIFYNLFDAISQVGIISGDEGGLVGTIADRIYGIIGVYAIFKVVFVLITMMINPDEASKGNNSIGKVGVRIVVMLALIIMVPYIFDKAYELQNAIVKENVIGQIILGDENTVNSEEASLSGGYGDAGQLIANKVFAGFVPINELAINEDTEVHDPENDDFNSETYLNDEAKNSCAKSFNGWLDLNKMVSENTPSTQGISSIGFSGIVEKFDSSETGDEEYCIDYKMFLSTIAGGLAAYMFIVYCLDIGLRVVKLAFYQLIAPIPIASYVDGKKDGPFQKWTKSCLTEYADIFLRLVIIYTVILLITEVDQILDFSVLEGKGATGLFAKAFIILGMLMFAKQAPQLIMDMFGVKDSSGRFGLNASEKLSKAGKVGTAITAGAGAAGALIGGGAGALAGGIAGTATGTVKGLVKGEPGKKGDAIKDNIAKSWRNAGIRGKASGIEALSRGQLKNYNDKGVYNKSVSGRNLARQAITGNVNATAGIGGKLAGWQSNLSSSLDFQTSKSKPYGLSMAGKIQAQLGNINTGLNAKKMELEYKAQHGDQNAVNELTPGATFNAKSVFETIYGGLNQDVDFQDLPSNNDKAKWDQLANDFTTAASATSYVDKNGVTQTLNFGQQEALRQYAEKALGDLKKQVDTMTKNKG